MIIGLLFWLLVVIFHNELALTFSYSEAALQVVNKLSLLLAFTILLNSIQPVLRGSIRLLSKDFTLSSTLPRHRRQSYEAYMNLGCCYLIGVPMGFLTGWTFNLGVMVWP